MLRLQCTTSEYAALTDFMNWSALTSPGPRVKWASAMGAGQGSSWIVASWRSADGCVGTRRSTRPSSSTGLSSSAGVLSPSFSLTGSVPPQLVVVAPHVVVSICEEDPIFEHLPLRLRRQEEHGRLALTQTQFLHRPLPLQRQQLERHSSAIASIKRTNSGAWVRPSLVPRLSLLRAINRKSHITITSITYNTHLVYINST